MTDVNSSSQSRGVSILVYGRNDSYGYNLHKRVAISLNCLAEQLEPDLDELLFVDCNSPDDVPTFPEAIADLLTARTKALLRIFRLRGADFRRLAKGARAPVLEGIARNVGIRRSSSRSRWILSTNTDVVLCTSGTRKFSELIASLEDGYYGLPRFDIPQALWEQLNRTDPITCIEAIQRWAEWFSLRLVVEVKVPFIRYDNPGDFQLVLRQSLFDIGGFDESMVDSPFNLDSNLAKRLSLKYGPLRSLLGHVEAFHCDHSRQAMARKLPRSRSANDWYRCVDSIDEPSLLDQQPDWGAGGQTVEEIRLGIPARYEQELLAVWPHSSSSKIRVASELGTAAALDDLLPFLADQLVCLPPGTKVALLGGQPDLASVLSKLLAAWVPDSELLIPHDAPALCTGRRVSLPEISAIAGVLIFDPGTRAGVFDADALIGAAIALATLQSRKPYAQRAKVIFLMAHEFWVRKLASGFYDLSHTPTATWIRHGKAKNSWRVYLAKIKRMFGNSSRQRNLHDIA